MNNIPSQREYEQRERREFFKKLEDVNHAPLAERKEAKAELAEALEQYPHIIAERVGWLLNGSYGYGSYVYALEIVGNPRMNRNAQLFTIIAALEWNTSSQHATQCYKALPESKKHALSAMISKEIEEYEQEQAEQAQIKQEEQDKRIEEYLKD